MAAGLAGMLPTVGDAREGRTASARECPERENTCAHGIRTRQRAGPEAPALCDVRSAVRGCTHLSSVIVLVVIVDIVLVGVIRVVGFIVVRIGRTRLARVGAQLLLESI